jgi:hypothetical protein
MEEAQEVNKVRRMSCPTNLEQLFPAGKSEFLAILG